MDELKDQELKLRQLIIETAQRGAEETAGQFQGQPRHGDNLSAPELQQELEVIQGARQFAQGLVVRIKSSFLRRPCASRAAAPWLEDTILERKDDVKPVRIHSVILSTSGSSGIDDPLKQRAELMKSSFLLC